jgi:hypothetical protein
VVAINRNQWSRSVGTRRLLNCLEDELDRLPLMQHALKLLYTEKSLATRRSDLTIDVNDFVRVFGLGGDFDLLSPKARLANSDRRY